MLASAFLPIHIQSQNTTHYSHWRKAHRQKQQIQQALMLLGRAPDLPTERRRLRIVSYRPRLLDVPNLWGGSTKHIIDGVVGLGWLHDDSPRWADIEVEQVQRRKGEGERGTLVEVHEVQA